MEFGIAIPTAADSYKVVKRAEELGFTHAWFTIQLIPGREAAIEDWARLKAAL